MSALKQTKKITKIIYFNLTYDTVAVIYRKPFIKLSISYLLEKNVSLAKKFLTVNDNPHLRAYRHVCACTEGTAGFFCDKKQILTSDLSQARR